jgi:hypothetical protein
MSGSLDCPRTLDWHQRVREKAFELAKIRQRIADASSHRQHAHGSRDVITNTRDTACTVRIW